MRPLRLPLQVGTTSLSSMTIGFSAIVPSIVIGGLLAAVWGGLTPFWVGLILAAGAAFGIAYGWRLRASDVAIEDAGFRVEGGPRHGLAVPWQNIEAVTLDLEQAENDDEHLLASFLNLIANLMKPARDETAETLFTMKLRVHTLEKVEGLGQADDAGEMESLRALAEVLRARLPHTVAAQAHPTVPAAVQIAQCPRCGAAAAPADSDWVRCAFCNSPVAVPHEIRERIRAARALPEDLSHARRVVTDLLAQPSARTTTAFLIFAFAFMSLAWPLTAFALIAAYRHHQLHGALLIGGVALPFLLILDGFFVARWRLVDRRAIGNLVFSFGARAPAAPGARPTCRSCGAAFGDEANEHVVVRCVYCGADNISGVDLRGAEAQTADAAARLDSALEQRRADRAKWGIRTLASIPFVALSVFVLFQYYHALHRVQPGDHRPKVENTSRSPRR